MADNTAPQTSNHPAYHQSYAPSPYYLSHQHSQNPNQQPDSHPLQVGPVNETHVPVSGLDLQTLRPPGVDPTSSSVGDVHEACDPSVLYTHSAYYQDPNVANSLKNWALEVLRYYGSNPNATGVTTPPTYAAPINTALKPRGNSTKKKSAKRTMVLQSAWCEVCKVECNTKEVLDKHKMGRKHKKNEEKLKDPIALPPPAVSGVSIKPVIGPQENPATSDVQETRKKAAEPVEDLETKRRRILEEGAASDAVRVCEICNVVCNSELVFAFHNAGKKHASMMMKKRLSDTVMAAAT